jgi:arginase
VKPVAPVLIIEAPYHMGLENIAVGAGPAKILAALDPVMVEHIRLRDKTAQGLDAVVDINRQIKTAVRQAREQGYFPVVLAGNCNSCLGTIPGMEAQTPGIVWLDRHGDFNTPETTISGSLEGMSLAIAVGHCHEDLRERIGFGPPVDIANVSLPLSPDLDPLEAERIRAYAVGKAYPSNSDSIYLHLDIDFVEDADAAANLVREIITTLPIAAVGLTNYNPQLDPTGRTCSAAVKLLNQLF